MKKVRISLMVEETRNESFQTKQVPQKCLKKPQFGNLISQVNELSECILLPTVYLRRKLIRMHDP
jgi:hypothetical protein